jgi:predicted PurR-regulated permease PerM
MSKNLGDYIVAWLIIIVVGIGVSFLIGLVAGVLAFIPCCGWILSWILLGVSGVYIAAVFAHLFGQIGAEPPSQSIVPGA